ncbi:hypothetical protein Nos7524_2494 [Nostoc sp. PCC 7524]|uniref:hypothetical protein n=1 Tax=Nostoc sp. (strain ATCC 29411 / PCC 7524) TaxID=28072 RepID=UPI00029EFFE4|nr:hypothetical protein [Nostoc sp. PCC 7524]AFY48334.1 hypothetical protein Nos7524_2494 [Nostoc sp. PCC 7524]
MTTKLKIIGVVIFCISASLIIPKVADATGTFHYLAANASNPTTGKLTHPPALHLQDSKDTYIPPNYGAPYSEYGTGTR